MQNSEVALFWHAITSALDRIIACLDGLDEEGLNWRPPAEGANSLYALATHMLANAEENLLGVLCGQPVARDREAEFVARGAAAEPLRARWRDVRERASVGLAALPASALDRPCNHPRRGSITGREVLLVVARHAAEHQGHAELTRDLLCATRSG